MSEVIAVLREAEFDIVKAYYAVNNLTYVNAEPLKISEYIDLVKIAIKRRTKLNILRTLAYPLVKMLPSLRQLIVVVSVKVREPITKPFKRCSKNT